MSQSDAKRETLDFRGVQCPYNYVKTKLYMEDMELNELVEVIVDEGEPSRHVPKSLQEDGQTILESFTDDDGRAHFVVQKTAEY